MINWIRVACNTIGAVMVFVGLLKFHKNQLHEKE